LQTSHGNGIGPKFSDDYDRNSYVANELRVHIHWLPSTTNTGNCLWKLEHWVSRRDKAYADGDVVTTSVLAAANGAVKEQITSLVAIDAAGFLDSTCVVFRLYRDGDGATDTFTGVAMAISVDAHIPVYSLGSEEEYGGAA
jgi:hypothetical protein